MKVVGRGFDFTIAAGFRGRLVSLNATNMDGVQSGSCVVEPDKPDGVTAPSRNSERIQSERESAPSRAGHRAISSWSSPPSIPAVAEIKSVPCSTRHGTPRAGPVVRFRRNFQVA